MAARDAMEILTKWRMVFAGWQLGTRPKGDAEADAVRDHREITLCLRAEVNAVTGLLIEKGIFTAEEFDAALEKEAELYSQDLSQRFRGMRASPTGIDVDLSVVQEHGTMDGWRP